jgi:hypothetical protein
MIALIIEFSCVVLWFLYLHRRQVRDRARARRLPWKQMPLELEDGRKRAQCSVLSAQKQRARRFSSDQSDESDSLGSEI